MRRNLIPGDIVRAYHNLGVVMRNDDDSGLLVAFPGNDELAIFCKPEAAAQELSYVGNLTEIISKLGLR